MNFNLKSQIANFKSEISNFNLNSQLLRFKLHISTLTPLLRILLLGILLAACSAPRNPEAEARAALQSLREKMRACLRESAPEGKVRLVVADISLEKEATLVRLVAYNYAEKSAGQVDEGAVDFDVPNYVMSRGRWLINESARAYLIDEGCREYKLNDRRLTLRQAEAKNGRIRLKPGEACEVMLGFPRLADDVQLVTLVYGAQALSVPFPPAQR